MNVLLVRDLAIAAVTLVLLVMQPSALPLQWLLGGLAGYLAYAAHEWAHLAGARAVRAEITLARHPLSPFLFSFDSERNSKRAFFHMTWPGFLATAVYIEVFFAFVPGNETWGAVARTIAFFLATLTVVIEGPIAVAALVSNVPAVEIPGLGHNRTIERLRGVFRS